MTTFQIDLGSQGFWRFGLRQMKQQAQAEAIKQGYGHRQVAHVAYQQCLQ